MSSPPLRLSPLCVGALSTIVAAQSVGWRQATYSNGPGPRTEHAMAYDTVRSVVVLFGGKSPSGATLHDTWEFDGSRWTQHGDPGGWPTVGTCSATFDSGRGKTVLVWGGSGPTQTYEWDGVAWALRVSGGPPPRTGFRVSYDGLRARTVLFGGEASTSYSDTWEWDGTNWVQMGSGGPPGRGNFAMCFDAQRGVTTLYGGRRSATNTYYSDTWEWNGIYWLEHFGIPGPQPRELHSMAYDTDTDRCVLFGGLANNATLLGDTWEWDGLQWLQRSLGIHPSNRFAGSMVYEAALQRFLLLGGQTAYSGGTTDETWHYAIMPQIPASFAVFGSGCAGPAGVPALSALPLSAPRVGNSLVMQLTQLPNSPLNLPFGLLGLSNTSWAGVPLPASLGQFGLTGCQAWISPDASYSLVNNNGTASWTLQIPFLQLLLGVDIYLQSAVLVPGWNPAGIVVSNAAHGVIGN